MYPEPDEAVVGRLAEVVEYLCQPKYRENVRLSGGYQSEPCKKVDAACAAVGAEE